MKFTIKVNTANMTPGECEATAKQLRAVAAAIHSVPAPVRSPSEEHLEATARALDATTRQRTIAELIRRVDDLEKDTNKLAKATVDAAKGHDARITSLEKGRRPSEEAGPQLGTRSATNPHAGIHRSMNRCWPKSRPSVALGPSGS